MSVRRSLVLVVVVVWLTALGCSASPSVEAGPASTDATSTTVRTGAGGAVGRELGNLKPEATGAFVGEAAQRTIAAQTGTFRVSMVIDEGGPDAFPFLEVQGTYDHDRGVSTTMLDISGLAQRAPMVLSEDPDEVAVMGLVFGEPLEVVEDADTTYLRGAKLTRLLQSPTEWVTMPLDSEDSFGGIASAFEVGDLSEFLSSLDGAGDVEDLGKEDLEGDDVWHYRVAIGDADHAGGLFGSMVGEVDDGGTVEVWVDDQGVIRRMVAVGSAAAVMPAFGADFGGASLADVDFGTDDITLVIELSDIGAPADIQIPAAADTTPLDSLGS